jgi:hypothetical protein
MSFGTAVRNAWVLFRSDAWVLIASWFLASFLGGATLGLLSLPLQAGVYAMVLRRVREGRKPQISDTFGLLVPFGRWLKAWLLILAVTVGLIMLIGVPVIAAAVGLSVGGSLRGYVAAAVALGGLAIVAALAVSFFLSTMWMLAVPFMGDRGLTLPDALGASWLLVRARGLWRHFAVVAFRAGLNLAVGLVIAGPTVVLAILAARGHTGVPALAPLSNALVYGASALLGSFSACLVGTVYLGDHDETAWLPSSLPPGAWRPDERWAAFRADQQRQWAEQWWRYDAWLRQQRQPPGGPGSAGLPADSPPSDAGESA